jgi:predicted TIM-barrel fold metal-dependent hydrolase
MTQLRTRSAPEIRSEVGHPIIDVDGHLAEFSTLLRDRILEMALESGGSALAAHIERINLTWDEDRRNAWAPLSEADRHDTWAPCMAWWGSPTRAVDRASAMLPALMHERMDELGIDYSVLFPSTASLFPLIRDDDVRRVSCRAFNSLAAELYEPYRDRLTPVAIVPTTTPEEAIDALEHAVVELGSKVILLGRTYRDIPVVAREHPGATTYSQRVESFGIDSEFDYDPFWQRCADLQVPVGVHHSEQGYGSRRSPSRYVYNHIGGFAAGSESICKSLVLGGVTRRFPSLRFAFLEGGVAWAAALLSDLVTHWEKRNGETILDLDPERTDFDELERLVRAYGPSSVTDRMDRAMEYLRTAQWRPDDLDDWRACGITAVRDFGQLFLEPFFFGCEADDRMTAVAFDTRLNPLGAKLHAVFGSDVGHWDVRDMAMAVPEAYELVEEGVISTGDFRDMTFTNAVGFLAGANPDFFSGTHCEEAVAEILAAAVAGAPPRDDSSPTPP